MPSPALRFHRQLGGRVSLRKKPFRAPSPAFAKKYAAVVVAEWALLPKFDFFRDDAIAGPAGWTWDLANAEAKGRGRDGLLEFEAAGHGLRLS